MRIFQTVRMAARTLLRNKMRSFLTTLGVVIGVGVVIAMVAIGEGAKVQVEAAFSSMGTNMLIVLPGTTTRGGSIGGFGTLPTLTWADLDAIRKEISTVKYAAANLRTTLPIVGDELNWTTLVNGTTAEFFDIRNWSIARGALLNESDNDAANKVVVLGQTVVDKLYGVGVNPIGRIVRIKNTPFQVIGVLASKGQSQMGQDYDDAVFIPAATFQSKIQGGLNQYISGVILISAVSPETITRAQRQVSELLRSRHQIQSGEDDDFSIRNLTEMANAQQQGTQTLTTLLAVIAAISLLVGGIGIMNIMLVSVTERTREIGIRMAIGAKPKHILLQFLIEALVLAVTGGFIGTVMGVSVAQWMSSSFGWPMLLRPDIIIVAFGFSAVVGIVFGLYPARKASLMDPIEALRYE